MNQLERNLRARCDGIEFENDIHNFLSHRTKKTILREIDIINKYVIYEGEKKCKICTAIDHLITTNNYIICIQDKWKKSSIGPVDINHFIASVNIVADIEKNKNVIGIYLSKKGITEKGKQFFILAENKTNIKYYNIFNDDENIIKNYLKNILYNYDIFFYEYDGSIEMIEN
jgi:hypothetical protein